MIFKNGTFLLKIHKKLKNFKKTIEYCKKKVYNVKSKRKIGRDIEMELVKNIFFNTDKLIENSRVKISYTGKFFQEGCQNVYAHYGFGSEWENVNEIEMEKTELGFQTEIELQEGETFNMCFRNEENEWDNNEGQNYIFPLEKMSTELIVLEDEPKAIGTSRKLRKSYLWSKKIRLAVYKILTYLPKIVSGNYKRKANSEVE